MVVGQLGNDMKNSTKTNIVNFLGNSVIVMKEIVNRDEKK